MSVLSVLLAPLACSDWPVIGESPFYYYNRRKIELVSAPELLSGVLERREDEAWLLDLASAFGLPEPQIRRRTRRGLAWFSLDFGSSASPVQLSRFRRVVMVNRRLRTFYNGYRTLNGSRVILTGDIVARLKESTTREQIEAFVRRTGVEIAEFSERFRRYVFSTVTRGQDPLKIANSLHETGWVTYSTPDFVTDINPFP
ncbi:MAG: hypothetical protein GTN62_07885 [Gemmatimonadales bacterium]|nr:hypothetical protein [Gemmatimonadales bacterium]NIN50020.1 hypothetical protein [Gemmatimonadales bacterium]NIP07484.1 hypothetical protein [Gemmatimonadales bacterium]NIR03123.1 hypothetical protein [Gemmatimonadales bacterium]NIS66835.1 hypothetical protein [Gemmatimonadales bacterium]